MHAVLVEREESFLAEKSVEGKSPYTGRPRALKVRESFSDKVRRICENQFIQTGTTTEEAACAIGRTPQVLQDFMDGGELSMDLFEDIWIGTRFETPEQFLALDNGLENVHSYRDGLIIDIHHTLSDQQLKRVHDVIIKANTLGVLEAVLTSGEMMIGKLTKALGRPASVHELRRSQHATTSEDPKGPAGADR